MEIELTPYIDTKQNVWFRGKNIAQILGYTDTTQASRKNVNAEDKKQWGVWTTGGLQQAILINESGFFCYSCLQNLNKLKNSNTGSHQKYSHQSENMGTKTIRQRK